MERRPPLLDKRRLTVPGLFAQTTQFMLSTCLPSESLQFWYMLGKGCLCDKPPIKTLDTESLMSFPGWQHFMCVATQVLCDSTGRGLLEPEPDFLQTSSLAPFSLCWFLKCSLAVMHYICEFNYILSPVIPPSKSQNFPTHFLHANLDHLRKPDLSHPPAQC